MIFATMDHPPVFLIGLVVMAFCSIAVTKGDKAQEDQVGMSWFSRFSILSFGICVFFATVVVECKMHEAPAGVTYVIGILTGVFLLLPGVRLVTLGIQLLIWPPRNVGGGHDTGGAQAFLVIGGIGLLWLAAYCVAWPWWPIH